MCPGEQPGSFGAESVGHLAGIFLASSRPDRSHAVEALEVARKGGWVDKKVPRELASVGVLESGDGRQQLILCGGETDLGEVLLEASCQKASDSSGLGTDTYHQSYLEAAEVGLAGEFGSPLNR